MNGFAERAARELRATGETRAGAHAATRSTSSPIRSSTSPGWRATGSPTGTSAAACSSAHRTAEYHLRKVFMKLGISSRAELKAALANLD